MPVHIESFFHKQTFTLCHLLIDENSQNAAIVDPVLDYCPASARTSTDFADRLIETLTARSLSLQWILETHVHADHVSGAQYLKEQVGGTVVIGAHVPIVQKAFGEIYDEDSSFATDGSQFDRLVQEGDTLPFGNMPIAIIETPGHTPACISYRWGANVFVGDTLFAPDYGTARCDFPGGDAGLLYDSIAKLFRLPQETKLYLCHDYMPGGRDLVSHTTVAEQQQTNVHIGKTSSRDEFIAMRTERDKGLDTPELMLPAVQINMRAGHLPPAAKNGRHYVKLPLNLF